ncbi:MAG: LacI family transcriptional regulator [Bacilli bacterium]|nr:LacI family transcriptional regulator [Bacilli bacterium]
MKYEKRVCLKTIAYDLGLSVNTVSRALRDCDDISDKTKEKVRKIAIELGYLPNNLVYSINKNETKLVALVINNVKNHYFSVMNEKLLYYLREAGFFSNIICLYGNAFDAGIVKECIYQRVDYIITFVEPTQDALDLVSINHFPLIMYGRKLPKKYCDTLYTDDVKGGLLAAQYLLDKGSKNFIYINVRGSECSKRRWAGFKSKLSLIEPEVHYKKINIEDFDNKIDEYLDYPDLGIFAYNDEHLFIVLEKLRQRNIDTSKINVVGYDGVCRRILGTTKIPSIAFDYDAMARQCVRLIKQKSEGNDEHQDICFDVHLEDI